MDDNAQILRVLHTQDLDRNYFCNNDEECNICMTEDRRKKIIQLNNCGHAFHATCLTSWVKAQVSPTHGRPSHATCPMCRQLIYMNPRARKPSPERHGDDDNERGFVREQESVPHAAPPAPAPVFQPIHVVPPPACMPQQIPQHRERALTDRHMDNLMRVHHDLRWTCKTLDEMRMQVAFSSSAINKREDAVDSLIEIKRAINVARARKLELQERAVMWLDGEGQRM